MKAITGVMVSLVLLGSAAMVWAGGEDEGSSESSSAGAMVSSGSYNEAPALAQLVASGDLPPVEERLPPEPLVVKVKDEIGQYGGAITAIKHSTGNWYMIAHVNIEPLMELDPEDSLNVVPNVARAWDWNADKSQLTVHLREGIKWSDGEPFTAEDLRFHYEDVQFNEQLTPLTPGAWMSHGSRMTFTQIDDSTVQFGFAGPSPAQLFMFTAANGYMNHYFPAHYFKELHIDYNEDADKKAKEEGLEEWWQLFNQTREKTRPYIHYPGPPYLFAWVPTSVTMDRTVWDRNPYYWKVDEAGNQLPYLDNIYGVLVVESELVKARGIAGEFDFLVEGFGMDEAPLLEQNAERYNYNVIIGPNTWAGAGSYYLNLNHKDPVRRELYRDKRFRQALSHAIDRDEINDIVFQGLATPLLGFALGDEPFYDEEVQAAEQEAIRYDVDEANRLLDEVGLTERDGDGYRLTSDGERLTLEVIHRHRPGRPGHHLRAGYQLLARGGGGVEVQHHRAQPVLAAHQQRRLRPDHLDHGAEPVEVPHRQPGERLVLDRRPLGAAVAQLVPVQRRVGRGTGRRRQGDARSRPCDAQRARRRQVAGDGQGVHDDVRRERVRHRHRRPAAAPDDLPQEHHEPVRRTGVDQRHRRQLPRARLPVVDQGVEE